MDNIQKQARKIRAKIRKDAIKAGLSTKDYRDKHGLTKDVIKQMAQSGQVETSVPHKSKTKEIEYKIPFDNLSNKPKYNSLQFEKPFLRIVYNKLYNFDFLVYLANNGHYLTKQKIYRDSTGQAVKIAN